MSGGLSERDARVLWHPYTQHALERAALPVVAANGAVLAFAIAGGWRVVEVSL